MRIIKGHDYYDGAVGIAGRDPEIVFVREPRLMTEDDLGIAGPERNRTCLTLIDLIVAGVRYRRVRASSHDLGEDETWTSSQRIIQDDASLERHVDPHRWWEGNLVKLWGRDVFEPRPVTASERVRLIEHRVTTAIFDLHSCPAGETDRFDWLVNSDQLKAYDLAKVLDPFTCFQEIATWVGGVLPRNPDPVVEITDDRVRAATHGFNDLSFRKEKSRPRGKRWARSLNRPGESATRRKPGEPSPRRSER